MQIDDNNLNIYGTYTHVWDKKHNFKVDVYKRQPLKVPLSVVYNNRSFFPSEGQYDMDNDGKKDLLLYTTDKGTFKGTAKKIGKDLELSLSLIHI